MELKNLGQITVRETVLAFDGANDEDLDLGKEQGDYTVDDLNNLPDTMRVELIDGIIYDIGAPSKRHQALIGAIHVSFYQYSLEHESCEVFLSPIDVQLDGDNRTMVQPDLVAICHKDDDKQVIWGAPEFVLEVLSPRSRSRDCVLKLYKYCNAGCREYWIIDGEKQIVTVYDFTKGGENAVPRQYSFDEAIPVVITGGELVIDFAEIRRQLKRYFA